MQTEQIYNVNGTSRLLKPTNRLGPIPRDPLYARLFDNYDIEVSSFWSYKKISFAEDTKNFKTAPADIQHSTMMVQAYFAASDDIVGEIIDKSPLSRITIPEAQLILNFEATMERIHAIVYKNTIVAIEPDQGAREKLLRAVETMPSVMLKADWARQWMDPNKRLDYAIVGKACVEGVNFSSSFAWIDWLKTQNYRFDGMFDANTEISRDEARHVDTGCILHDLNDDKIAPDNVKEIIDGALEVEYVFIDEVINERGYIGMNRQLLKQHTKHCAAMLATDLGYTDFYKGTSCPFPFVKLRSLNSKTNFFEKKETEYKLFTADDNDADDGVIGDTW